MFARGTVALLSSPIAVPVDLRGGWETEEAPVAEILGNARKGGSDEKTRQR